ncbi:MAG: tRNA (adenosine(37)-N6)-threonylcarbamoyltransferase complex dimerization subunit type 1 TsaB [Mycobacteriales bacterium]|nr:tRNA (adenosine(37)-N6)-threonylcarbamoyltransferase complex dimerization subunit type 1 TsaB [Mycobacteriales bacterium]
MLVLGLDTSTPAVSAALVELEPDGAGGARWVDSATWQRVDAKRHGELLATGVHELLGRRGVRPRDLAAVAVGLGPGPFTGLRVGVVTAATMADALGIPAYGACSLDAVGAWTEDPGRRLVVTDARRREVYWAEYDEDGERLAGPSVLAPAELSRRLRETSWPQPDAAGRVVGDGALLHRDAFEGFDVSDDDRYPSADAVVLLAAVRVVAGAPSEPLTPLYLRRPDAEQPAAPKRVTA